MTMIGLRHTRTSTFRVDLVSVPLVLMALALAWPGQCQSADPPSESEQLTAQQQEKLKQRDRYIEQIKTLRDEGKIEQAIATAEKMLAIEREVYGDVHEDVAGSLEWLAKMHEESEAWDAARQARQQVLKIKDGALRQRPLPGHRCPRGVDEPRTTCRAELQKNASSSRKPSSLTVKSSPSTVKASTGGDSSGQPGDGNSETVLGEEHPDYATSLNNLACLYNSMGEYAKAEPLYRQALEIRKRVLGEEHPTTPRA